MSPVVCWAVQGPGTSTPRGVREAVCVYVCVRTRVPQAKWRWLRCCWKRAPTQPPKPRHVSEPPMYCCFPSCCHSLPAKLAAVPAAQGKVTPEQAAAQAGHAALSRLLHVKAEEWTRTRKV